MAKITPISCARKTTPVRARGASIRAREVIDKRERRIGDVVAEAIQQRDKLESRADYQVYDRIKLNDGTGLFYERSEKLCSARLTRNNLDNGEEIGDYVEIYISPEDSLKTISLKLNNYLIGGER